MSVSGPSTSYPVTSATGGVPNLIVAEHVDKAVTITTEKSVGSLFTFGIFADSGPLNLLGLSATDSYDSCEGPYGVDGNVGNDVCVISNYGTI